MKTKQMVVLVMVATMLITMILLMIPLSSRSNGGKNESARSATVMSTATNLAIAAEKPAELSLEEEIEKVPDLFVRFVNDKKGDPVSLGQRLGWQIFNMTNVAERAMLIDRYTRVLLAIPLDRGTYSDRANGWDNIWRMSKSWTDVLWRLQLDSEKSVGILLAIVERCRDSAEKVWNTDISEMKSELGETRSGLFGSYKVSTEMRTRSLKKERTWFAKNARLMLPSIARQCKEISASLIRQLPSNEQTRINRNVEESIKRIGIEKLLDSMEQELKRDKQ